MNNMKNIILTSCGIIKEDLKNSFYKIINKDELKYKKVLYITTAVDGEDDGDKPWMAREYKAILDLGINESNITEYKIGSSDIDINNFDIIYMLGGNTFYLLDMIRKYNFDDSIRNFINKGKIYIGSSAGSEILGSSIEPALPYDKNKINMHDFSGLKLVNGLIIPHSNKKEEFINNLKNNSSEELYLLYDGDGIII